MKPQDARDHLEMLSDIVRSTDRTVFVAPAMLLAIGIICSATLALIQVQLVGWAILPGSRYVQAIAVLGLILTIAAAVWRRRNRTREALVDSYAGWVFLSAFAMALTLTVTAQGSVIPAEGIGLIWAGSMSMALLVCGAMGNRVLLGGGVAMLITVAIAGLVRDWLPGMLAIAWLVGFAIPGAILQLGSSSGRAAAV